MMRAEYSDTITLDDPRNLNKDLMHAVCFGGRLHVQCFITVDIGGGYHIYIYIYIYSHMAYKERVSYVQSGNGPEDLEQVSRECLLIRFL